MTLAGIGSYAIAFIILTWNEVIFFPITLLSCAAFKNEKWLAPFSFLLINAIKLWLAVILAAWLINKIGQLPTWLMFLIPGCLVVLNDVRRITRVVAGRSRVQRLLDLDGEPESYDRQHDLLMELAYLTGDISGWIIGTSLALPSSALF